MAVVSRDALFEMDYLSVFDVALFGKRSCELLVSHSPVDRARELPITP